MYYPILDILRLPCSASTFMLRLRRKSTSSSSAVLTTHYGGIDIPSPPLL